MNGWWAGDEIEYGIEVARPEDSLTLRADPAMLHQVLTNLIRNACEAMGESGTLTLSAQKSGDEAVFLKVADSGPGGTFEL